MNTKHILALVTFVVAFSVSSVIAGFFLPVQVVRNYPIPANRIETVEGRKISLLLRRDVRNDWERANSRVYARDNVAQSSPEEALDQYVAATETYVSKLEALKTSDLPQDFQMAWQEHVQAWRQQADFLNSVGDISGSRISDISQSPTYQQNTAEINSSWWEILQLANLHGARIPADAY